jgi:hypothetical protein
MTGASNPRLGASAFKARAVSIAKRWTPLCG